MLDNIQIPEITGETLRKILDHSSDEIFVIDRDQRIIFVNSVCEKHYGLKPEDVVGKQNAELFEMGYWKPSIVPLVFKEKKPVTIRQSTYIGAELLTTAVPILNEENEIELIVTTSQEMQTFKQIKKERENHPAESPHSIPITNCQKMKDILKVCEKIAKVDSTILIQGESGTGKGVLAQYIHDISKRKNKTFLKLNCAALPEDLLESELFGYAEGAFTGASKHGKKGLLEIADQGTLFLDEIGELPLSLQAKLLQVIQEKQYLPIGGYEMKKVDVRIIAATNRDLVEMVGNKVFREDLFYRLNIIDIHLPPLRERREDIIPLTYNFLYKFNKKYEMNKIISQECLDIFHEYSWPGNIRQLENVMERLVVTSDSTIQRCDLPELITQNIQPHTQYSLPARLDDAIEHVKKTLVVQSYKKNKSSRKVAKDLNISQTRAVKLISQYCGEVEE
ncbi:sigma-54 interaction domain-containing protein [Neobacillus rhizophilus]|uniref:Sigma 54-interacting transcriptional regulator n=1 Tax=Neobacillus rhizophilus TaxID=2833579 RepID=A0A942UEE4_9BACI|nr:sigma 54-interacting transcriptional regulator [Neobacillus rhizophilus]MBS4216664.1 sigma 54-interacting transcriptional regulator [Neobacillus rhizophilus]